jgi:hypothetical protein
MIDGRFRIDAELGRGATSIVYAVDAPTGERLALKRLAVSGRSAELRFRREYQTLVRLAHPSVIAALDYGLDTDVPYYTMELAEGPTLEEQRPGYVRDACAVLHQLASALAHLHARRLVHRDLSPRNVRRTAGGKAKLLDFGALSTVGVASDVLGTPPFVAPEALRRLPLDGRTDIFGLGALAHFLLVGTDAFPAARLDQLEGCWRQPPPPLRALRPELPAGLEALIASMLSVDPIGRPVSMVEVMERLSGIAELDPSELPEAEPEWPPTTLLIGRAEELTLLRDAARDAGAARGRVVAITASSGLGKTRLLQEAALEARIAGATVLRATGDAADRGPFGVLAALVHDALAICPDEVLAAARSHPLIAVALPELAGELEALELEPADPNEARLRVHQALLAWLTELARARPLALLVDDAQRADEASVAVLAALARSSELGPGLFLALRTDEPVRSPAALGALIAAAHVIPLQPLSLADTRALVTAWLGDLPAAERVADWLQRFGAGSPLHYAELSRFLLAQGLVRRRGGKWSLARELPEQGLPAQLAEAFEARVAALGQSAQRLAEALAVAGSELPLELCVALYEGNEDEAFAALDELVVEDLIAGSASAFSFRHDGLREAVQRRLSGDRLRALHLRAGKALLAHGVRVPEHEAQIGWHLLQGGERAAAATHLALAGRRLYEAHSFRDAIAPLRACLEILEAGAAAGAETLELRLMLIRSGTVCDRALLLAYADDTIALLRSASGVAIADRTRRVLGRRAALATGVAWRFARRSLLPAERSLPGPIDATVTLISLVNFAASARSLAYEIPELRSLVSTLEPLTGFRMPRLAHALASSFLHMSLGLWGTVRERSSWLLSIVERERFPLLAEIDQKMAIGAARYMRASIAVLDQDRSYAAEIQALRGLDLRFFDVAANAATLLYHRMRGEEPATEAFERQHEIWSVQLGSAWAFDSQIAWMSAIAYGLTGDLLGLKRSAEQIEALVGQGYRLGAFAALARGDYLRQRGELARSRALLERGIAEADPEQVLGRQLLAAALSETCLAEGDARAALEAARRGLELGEDPERRTRTGSVRCGRAQALALSALGRGGEGAAQLDRLLAEIVPVASPTLSGLLHGARARLATDLGDAAGAAHHRAALESCWRATQNPALIAQLAAYSARSA